MAYQRDIKAYSKRRISMAVNNPCKEYNRNKKRWDCVRDCIEGEDQIKSRTEAYLPRLSGQSDEEYTAYLKKANFFGATGRAADGLHGDVFAKPPVHVGNPPEEFRKMIEDVDLMGTSLDQFASDIIWDDMQTNWGGILTDYSRDADMVNRAQAEQAGYSAYLKWYPAETLINWKYGLVDGKTKLIKVVLEEPYTEESPQDAYEEVEYIKYRVLTFDQDGNYVQYLHDSKVGLETFETIHPKINGNALREIPFYTCPGRQPEKSMLLDLAFENVHNFQQSGDYEHGKHYTSIPTPIAIGVNPPVDENGKPKPVSIGGTKFVFFPNDSGNPVDVKYLEFTGAGIEAMEKGIQASEQRMAILGAHIISGEKKGVETAEAARIHRAGENGVLSAFVRNISEQITKAMRLKAVWDGITEEVMEEWQYVLNTDYDMRREDAQILSVMLQGRQSGEVPKISLFRALKNIELIPEDWDFDMYLEEAEKDAPKLPAREPVEYEQDRADEEEEADDEEDEQEG
jgi:hypothetical protein